MGTLAYCVLAHSSPYSSDDPTDMVFELAAEGPDLSRLPFRYREVVGRALRHDPSLRYGSAGEFAYALSSVSRPPSFLPTGDPSMDGMLGKALEGDHRAIMELLGSEDGGMAPVRDRFWVSFPDSWTDELTDEVLAVLSENEGSCGEAVDRIRESAEAGSPAAQCMVGLMCYLGIGMSIDYEESVRFFRSAAVQGYADAQYYLGQFYDLEEVVPHDAEEAVKWYREAVRQGHAVAKFNLGSCFERGEGVEQDLEEAARLYREAAIQGYGDAQYNLGVCYRKGRGVPQDAV
ncbi:MAG: SEL1-like repeat protein [Candidatus Methanomethylophilaceae archaeon]|nr:SEL1-like repeat protein [Candidatus Methanomethylophilaceae archaeon]